VNLQQDHCRVSKHQRTITDDQRPLRERRSDGSSPVCQWELCSRNCPVIVPRICRSVKSKSCWNEPRRSSPWPPTVNGGSPPKLCVPWLGYLRLALDLRRRKGVYPIGPLWSISRKLWTTGAPSPPGVGVDHRGHYLCGRSDSERGGMSTAITVRSEGPPESASPWPRARRKPKSEGTTECLSRSLDGGWMDGTRPRAEG